MVPGKKYTPEDFLQILWRRKWLIVLPFVVATAGTVVYSRSLPSLYKSETLILVVPQQVPRSYVAPTVTVQIDQRLQTISQQVLSRSRLEQLIQEFDLYSEQRKRGIMEDIVERMRLDVTVAITRAAGQQSGTSFRVGYVSRDPVKAMRVTERLATLFIDANLRDRELLAEGTDQFIEAELNAARRTLEEQERAIEGYRRKNPGDQPEHIENNRWTAANAQQALTDLVRTLDANRERLLFLEKMVADFSAPGSEVAPSKVAAGAAQRSAPPSAAAQLEAARNSLRALELRLKPEHPDILRAKRTIAELERKAEEEALATPLSPELLAARSLPAQEQGRLLNLRDEINKLKRSIAEGEAEEGRLRTVTATLEQRIANYPARVREMAALTRDYDTIKTHYHDLLRKKESSKISANLERRQIGEQMRIVDPARPPQRPFSPDRARINLMGAALGLGLGLGLAALFEYRDTSLRTENDVLAALALPVLALVPVMRTRMEVRRSRKRRLIWSLTGALTLLISAAAVVWTLRS
jgi:polysaccharide chain length determinant protein (PEP-CTERM system associated)